MQQSRDSLLLRQSTTYLDRTAFQTEEKLLFKGRRMKKCALCGAETHRNRRVTVKIGRLFFKKKLYFCTDCFCNADSQAAKQKVLDAVSIYKQNGGKLWYEKIQVWQLM